MVELAAEPAMKGVFLYADLEAIGVVLGYGEDRGLEDDGGAANHGVLNKISSVRGLHTCQVDPKT